MAFLGSWIVNAVAVAAADWLVAGIYVVPDGSWGALFLAALVLSLVNTAIRPVVRVLSLPLTVLTLGIFHFVVNALMLELASWLSLNLFGAGIVVSGFWPAFWGALIISAVATVTSSLTGLGKE